MTIVNVKKSLESDKTRELFSRLYGADQVPEHIRRYGELLDVFRSRFGDGDARLFSAPGRTEIGGNHTDHNNGRVLAASIRQDCIAVAAATGSGLIRVHDETYGEDFEVNIAETAPIAGESGSRALVRGILGGFTKTGSVIGGFDACFSSRITPASGISSSAAFEMVLCCILNNLYNKGALSLSSLAGIGQYAENAYWNKASGLQDQMASALGGLIAIDFENPRRPVVKKIPFDFEAEHTALILVNTGGNHADLSAEYSSIPAEMRAAAKMFGQESLRGISVDDLVSRLPVLRESCGDRAALRALHFAEEDRRVEAQIQALKSGDFAAFLKLVNDSGNSSWKWLQNVSVPSARGEAQHVAVCLAVTEVFIRKHGLEGRAACRVHGGGFGGVIQVFLPDDAVEEYTRWMLTALGASASAGENPVIPIHIRPLGAVEVLSK
jgi:galactokinase